MTITETITRRKQLPPAEELRTIFSYDPETGHLIYRERPSDTFSSEKSYRTWKSRFCGKVSGTKNPNGYVLCWLNGTRYAAHRLIWKILYDEEPEYLDHINGVRSDNRIANLRSVSSAENAKNNCIRSDNVSGVVGVFRNGRSKGLPWVATIATETETIVLGRFAFLEDAIAVRKSAETRFGFHENHGRDRAMIEAGRVKA